MRNSRAKTTTTTHAGMMFWPTRMTSTVMTRILSASGSRNLPSSVTELRRRAISPSSVSVAAAVAYTTALTWAWYAKSALNE